MNTADAVYESYITPFRIVEELKLKCGYEKSFKLIENHLLRNRYLIGIDKRELDRKMLAGIVETMRMPEQFVTAFNDGIGNANQMLLGFEQAVDRCIYKIYLEYWDELKTGLQQQRAPHQPATVFVGYKWNVMDNSEASLTDYVCFPKIGLDEILNRIDARAAPVSDRTAFDIAREIINLAARQSKDNRFIYLEASENNNPRISFDINLYPANLKLREIYPQMLRLGRHYSVSPGELERLFGQINDALLGHLSAGTSRVGAGFFSVYYDNETAS